MIIINTLLKIFVSGFYICFWLFSISFSFFFFWMLKNQHFSSIFHCLLATEQFWLHTALGKEMIGSDLEKLTSQKGELFLLRVFSLDRSLGKNYSQRQPQTSCPLMLQHAGNNLPLETSMYLLLLLFGTALCYALYKHGAERGFLRAQNICRRVGRGVVLLHTCCCST